MNNQSKDFDNHVYAYSVEKQFRILCKADSSFTQQEVEALSHIALSRAIICEVVASNLFHANDLEMKFPVSSPDK